jgi:hypothetical protein
VKQNAALAEAAVATDKVVKSTQQQWHIDLGAADTILAYDDGLHSNERCIKDEGEKPGSKSTGGFYLQDNTLYLISGIGTLFRVDQTYTRK